MAVSQAMRAMLNETFDSLWVGWLRMVFFLIMELSFYLFILLILIFSQDFFCGVFLFNFICFLSFWHRPSLTHPVSLRDGCFLFGHRPSRMLSGQAGHGHRKWQWLPDCLLYSIYTCLIAFVVLVFESIVF